MLLLGAGDALSHVLDHHVIGPITVHTITLIVAAALGLWCMMMAAKSISTGPASQGHDRYLTRGRIPQLIEMMVVFLRDQMLEPVLGEKHTRQYLPFLLTLFFFILANNLFGLIPLLDLQLLIGIDHPVLGGAATGNLAVTGALAIFAMLAIQFHGFRELGFKGWAHHLLGGAPWWLFPLMVPVELVGHIIKPAALAIRLFANMVAGHTLLATLFLFGYDVAKGDGSALAIAGVSFAAGLFALAISFLELFVAVLQAFIFMFLTAVFISLMSHHDEHEHGHEEDLAAHPVTD